MNSSMKQILAELQSVADALPESAVKACTEKINAHSRIFVYGAGRSGLMLRALAMRLMQMGKCVYVVGETVTPAIGEGDLLVLASASGNTHSVCHYAGTAKSCGANLLIITAAESSALTDIQAADMRFSVPDKDSAAAGGQVMGSLFEQTLLLFGDAVVQCLAADSQMMRKNHANLE